MQIPTYPGSRELDLGDKKLFDGVFSETKPEICEYTFANLFAWRQMYNFSVSAFEEFILLKSGKGNAASFFEPVGKGDKKGVITKIMRETGMQFTFVSEDTKKLFEEVPDISISSDPANSDYVYSSKDLIGLKGKKYDGKRNFIKRYRSANLYNYVVLNGDSARNCVAFAEEWCKYRDCEGIESLKFESLAVKEMLENFSALGLSGAAIEIKNKICSMAIGENLNTDTFVVHILKAKDGITGLNQTMHNEFLSKEAAGFKFVNLEQDLGLEGLRKSKQSYHPLKLINKYILSPKKE